MSADDEALLDDAALDRLLAQHPVPSMDAGLLDCVVAAAQRPDRPRLAPLPRSIRRRWPRKSAVIAIVAANLIVASAVAAAYGSGLLNLAKLGAVARTIAHHIHSPHHHPPRPQLDQIARSHRVIANRPAERPDRDFHTLSRPRELRSRSILRRPTPRFDRPPAGLPKRFMAHQLAHVVRGRRAARSWAARREHVTHRGMRGRWRFNRRRGQRRGRGGGRRGGTFGRGPRRPRDRR